MDQKYTDAAEKAFAVITKAMGEEPTAEDKAKLISMFAEIFEIMVTIPTNA